MADLGLTDAVDAAEALLDAVRVPGQVVVHHQVGTLQVDALPGRVRGEQHLHLRVVQEGFLGLAAVLAAHAAVNDDDGVGPAQQSPDASFEVGESVPVLGEQDQLLVRGGNGGRDVAAAGRPWPCRWFLLRCPRA